MTTAPEGLRSRAGGYGCVARLRACANREIGCDGVVRNTPTTIGSERVGIGTTQPYRRTLQACAKGEIVTKAERNQSVLEALNMY